MVHLRMRYGRTRFLGYILFLSTEIFILLVMAGRVRMLKHFPENVYLLYGCQFLTH